MPTIDVINLSFSFSAQPLLNDVSFSVGHGERAVLVGPNGSGKTTLLRLVRGELTPDQGSIAIGNAGESRSFRSANVYGTDDTVHDYLNDVLVGPRALLARFEHVTKLLSQGRSSSKLVEEYDQLLTSLTLADAWSLEARIDQALGGLGLKQFTGRGRQRKLGSLSLGQVGRLELAGLLLARPAALVLDEPTNHLDDEAIAYLTEQITSWPGPVLMASHDRGFIEDTATVIYDLDIAPWQALATSKRGGDSISGVYRCTGAYSDYRAAKRHARLAHQKLHDSQQAEKRLIRNHRRASQHIAHGGVRLAAAQGKERKYFSDRAAKTALRHTRNDDKRLDDLAEREVRKPRDYHLKIRLPQVKPRDGLAVAARSAAIPGRLLGTTFDLSKGDHLLVTGSNGAGKTTLLNWIARGKPPIDTKRKATGTISVTGHIAHIPQRLPRTGDPYFNPHLWTDGIGEFGAGILHPSMWNTSVDQLSDGNQRRAQIALAMARSPEILIIDEPTNYLDLAAMEELEATLQHWNGTLIIASHDRWFIDHWQGKHLKLSPSPERQEH